MAEPSDWADAYIHQARADLAAAESLAGQHVSVLAMLLQMTFEKTAKAALLYGGRVSVEDTKTNHRAALSLMKIFKDHSFLLKRLTGSHEAAWRPVVVTVENITKLHPQNAGSGPWLEYPWHDAQNDDVHWPERDLAPTLQSIFSTEQEQLGRLPSVFRFAHLLCDEADEVFTP